MEEKQKAVPDSRVLAEKAHALPSSRQVMPNTLDRKRKRKAKKRDSFVKNASFIGETINGVVDGLFEAGYFLTVRVGDTDTILKGVVFEPGRCVPITEANDIAPNVKRTKRDETVLVPQPQHASNALPLTQHSHIPMLPAPVSNDDVSAMASLHAQNQMEPPKSNNSGKTNVVSPRSTAGPFVATFISPTVSRLPSPMLSLYEVPKSVILQSQMGLPVMIISGQKDIVVSQQDAIPGKSTTISQPVPVRMPIANALATSSVHAKTEIKLPETTSFGQIDMLTLQPGTTSPKPPSMSESGSRFPLSMNAPAVSLIHVQHPTGPPVSSVSCQTNMVVSQPDAIPPKSTTISKDLSVPSAMSKANTQATTAAHVENMMGPPTVTGSRQTDMMLSLQDVILSKSSSDSQGISSVPSPMLGPDNLPKSMRVFQEHTALPFPVLVQHTQLTSSVHSQDQLNSPKTLSNDQTCMMSPQSDVIPSKSISVSQMLPMMPSLMRLPNTQLSSSALQNQINSPSRVGSSQTYSVVSQLDTIPSVPASVSQTLPIVPVSMPIQYTQGPSAIIVQNLKGPFMSTDSGQTDMSIPSSDLTSSKAIYVPKDSAHRGKESDSGQSEKICDSIVSTETHMDVGEGA